MNTLFWRHDKKGKRWTARLFDDGPILGSVSWNFDGWNGIVCVAGNKWPESQRSVYAESRRFWAVRRAVEYEISKAHRGEK